MTSTYDDEIIINQVTFDELEDDTYNCAIVRIEPFQGKDFNTGEPKDQLRIVFEILDAGYEGKTVDRIVSKSLNEKSVLYGIWKAATGAPPEPGSHGVKAALVGKRVQCVVETKPGSSWPRVSSVNAMPKKKKAPVVVVDDSDDLDDA